MNFRDDMLMTLFGGGTADYDMLDKCEYDADDVLAMVKGFTTLEDMTFNDILQGAIDVFKNNIQGAIERKIEKKEDNLKYLEKRLDYCAYGKSDLYEIENEKAELEQLYELDVNEDIECFLNYLDTHIYITDEETRKIYKEQLADIIDDENDRIGFVELDLD